MSSSLDYVLLGVCLLFLRSRKWGNPGLLPAAAWDEIFKVKGNLKTHFINLQSFSPINTFLIQCLLPKQRNKTGWQARRHLFDFSRLTPSLRANLSVLASQGWSPCFSAHYPGFPKHYNGDWQVAAKLRLYWACERIAMRIKWDVKYPAQSTETVWLVHRYICARPGHRNFPLCCISKFGSQSSICDWFHKCSDVSNKKEQVSRFQMG